MKHRILSVFGCHQNDTTINARVVDGVSDIATPITISERYGPSNVAAWNRFYWGDQEMFMTLSIDRLEHVCIPSADGKKYCVLYLSELYRS